MAEQAREARVRLSEGSPTVALQQFMTERLRLIDSDLEAVTWDAYRSDDGTWQVTGAWRAGDKSGTTRWSFDLPSRTVAPSDAATTGLRRGHPPGPRRPRRAGRPGRAPAPRARRDRRAATPAGPTTTSSTTRSRHRPTSCRRTSGRTTTSASATCTPRAGSPTTTGRSTTLLDEVAEHDTVVLGRSARGRPRPTTRAPASRRGRTSSSGSAATAEPLRRQRNSFASVSTCRLASAAPWTTAPHAPHRDDRGRLSALLRLWPFARPYRGLIALTFTARAAGHARPARRPAADRGRRRRADRRRRPRRARPAAGARPGVRHRRGGAVLPAPLGDEPAAACGSSATCATPSTSGCSGCRWPSTTAGPRASCSPARRPTSRRSAASSGFAAVFLAVNLITCVVVLDAAAGHLLAAGPGRAAHHRPAVGRSALRWERRYNIQSRRGAGRAGRADHRRRGGGAGHPGGQVARPQPAGVRPLRRARPRGCAGWSWTRCAPSRCCGASSSSTRR